MKSKWIFWGLTILVPSGWTIFGFLMRREHPLLLWITAAMAVVTLILFVALYRRIIKPHQMLLRGAELLKEEDFSSRLSLRLRNKEADLLIEIFNRMMSQLKEERLRLREQNHFLDLLIQASPQGVIVLDFDHCVSQINPAGLKLLKIADISGVMGVHVSKLPADFSPKLGQLSRGQSAILRTSGGSSYRCTLSSFVDRGFDRPFLIIEELTSELIRVEKESYERIIRMMSHEVNNSIAAISAVLNVVSDAIQQNDDSGAWTDIRTAVLASFDRCGRLVQFVKDLAEVVKIPEPIFSHISLNRLVHSVFILTKAECSRRNIRIITEFPNEDQPIFADGVQLEQVFVNIIKNSWEAIDGEGEIHLNITVNPLTLTIADNGSGISPEVEDTLFTSFFTTKTTGYGIGLTFVREVLNNHGLKFDLSSSGGWTRFKIVFD